MNGHEFTGSAEWSRHKREMTWEVVAVALPVIIYGLVALFLLLIPEHPEMSSRWMEALGKPDSFFGSSILFFFAAIHGLNSRVDAANISNSVAGQVGKIRWIGILAGTVCAICGALAIVFHPWWSMPIGLMTMIPATHIYWRASFFRMYIEHGSVHRHA
jgi:hypothetical protein